MAFDIDGCSEVISSVDKYILEDGTTGVHMHGHGATWAMSGLQLPLTSTSRTTFASCRNENMRYNCISHGVLCKIVSVV